MHHPGRICGGSCGGSSPEVALLAMTSPEPEMEMKGR